MEDAKKMDENKKKDTLKRMGEMADLNAIRQIKECLLKNEKGDIKGTVQNYMMIFRDDPLIQGCLRYNRLSERVVYRGNFGGSRLGDSDRQCD